jgi:hypothetical protein
MSKVAALKIETLAAICARHEPRVPSGLRDLVLVCLAAFAGVAVSLLAPAGGPPRAIASRTARNGMPMPAW